MIIVVVIIVVVIVVVVTEDVCGLHSISKFVYEISERQLYR